MGADLFRREIEPVSLSGTLLQCRVEGCGSTLYAVDLSGGPGDGVKCVAVVNGGLGWPSLVQLSVSAQDLWGELSEHEKLALLRRLPRG